MPHTQPVSPQEQGPATDLDDVDLGPLLLSSDSVALNRVGNRLVEQKRYSEATPIFKRLVELDGRDASARFMYAQLIEDGSHRKHAESRDMMLSILADFPEIFDHKTDTNLTLIRYAAIRCSHAGPIDKAMELFRKLAPMSGTASDYFQLSEILTQGNFLEESVAALEKAIQLDPEGFDTDANRETLRMGKSRGSRSEGSARTPRKKIGRYPLTEDFHGDLQTLIREHIAANLRSESKFINGQTRFFTMGSCFARNISISLARNGYASNHLDIAEHVNTTFANRAFVDWLQGAGTSEAVSERIRELLPPQWSAEKTRQILRDSNVFILTLGVAPAFFDRSTGEFVLPRPTALNSRVLAEKYQFRTTTVQENVDNVLYLINFVRSMSPGIKVVVTVSPVPLIASFEFESCVQADCLSKSTMRLVAHEVVNNSGLADIIYWPSFEVFRWAGSNASDYFAADDGAAWHVSEQKVNETMKAFVDIFKG